MAACRGLPQLAADVHAVDIWQPEVEQHDVGRREAQRLPGPPSAHALGRVPSPVETANKLGGDTRIVLHHQHMSHAYKVVPIYSAGYIAALWRHPLCSGGTRQTTRSRCRCVQNVHPCDLAVHANPRARLGLPSRREKDLHEHRLGAAAGRGGGRGEPRLRAVLAAAGGRGRVDLRWPAGHRLQCRECLLRPHPVRRVRAGLCAACHRAVRERPGGWCRRRWRRGPGRGPVLLRRCSRSRSSPGTGRH